jgi:DNA polymerase-3 subunit epsilon
MDELQVRTLGEVLRYQRGLLPGEPELVAPPLIAQALKEKRQLRIIYNSVSTPIAHERIIEPLELAKIRGKLYLRAYCHLRKDNRSFALDKIESMEFADMSFQA